MRIAVLEYVQQDGKSPYQQWFDKLPAQAAAKVATATVRLELGNISAIKWFDGIGEYRIHWGPGLRIYLARDGEKIILLLGGGDKSSQRKDISLAKKRWSDYRARKTP